MLLECWVPWSHLFSADFCYSCTRISTPSTLQRQYSTAVPLSHKIIAVMKYVKVRELLPNVKFVTVR